MKTHKLKLTTCEVEVEVEFISSNYFAITFLESFDDITVYADVYISVINPDWLITVGKHSNEDKEVFDYLMDKQGLVEAIKHLLFNGDKQNG